MNTRTLAILAFCLMAGLVSGCGKDRDIRFYDTSSAPDKAIVQKDRIEVAEGIAVRSYVKPIEDGDDADGISADDVTFETDDPNILGVAPGKDDLSFVFFGVRTGTTTVTAYIEGDVVREIPVSVVVQSPLP